MLLFGRSVLKGEGRLEQAAISTVSKGRRSAPTLRTARAGFPARRSLTRVPTDPNETEAVRRSRTASVASVVAAVLAFVLVCAVGPVSLLLALLGLVSGLFGARHADGRSRRVAMVGLVLNGFALGLFGMAAAFGAAIHTLFLGEGF